MSVAMRRVLAAALLLPLAWLLLAWPLSAVWMAGFLLVYAALLWRWPWAWMVVLPAAFPLLDLTPWSGWMLFGAPDMLWLVTLSVLLWQGGAAMPLLSPLGRGAVVCLTLSLLIGMLIGLTQPPPPGGSDLIYLTAANGLRLAKPWFEALALLPFLAARLRQRDGVEPLLAGAALLGLGIALSVAAERAVFVGMLNFSSDYRVVGTFSSMHIGGGHIGAALALVLGCVVAGFATRLRPVMLLVLAPVLYALTVTYARAAYAAALAAAGTAALAALAPAGLPAPAPRRLMPLVAMLVAAGLVGLAAFESPMMSARFGTIAPDLATREGNWSSGLALHQGGALSWLFGEGLGTLPRIAAQAAARAGVPQAGPSYYRRLATDPPGLELVSRTPLYFGHRVDGAAPGETLRLALRYRVHAPGAPPTAPQDAPRVAVAGQLSALLCEKWLLYSLDCAAARFAATTPGTWEMATATLVAPAQPWRPLELSFTTAPGAVIDLSAIQLTAADGRALLANGDFSAGLTHWFFTDDNHLVWRMKDQYLMTLFETGLFGLLAWLGVILAACLRGEPAVLAVAAAVLASSLFDAVLEAPRLAFVIDLFLLAGTLCAGHGGEARPAFSGKRSKKLL